MPLNNVPLPGQNLRQTRDPINQNFSNTDSGFAVNHLPLNSGVNSGKHKFIQMAQNASPATLANEAGIYAAVGASSGKTELYFQPQNKAAGVPGIPMTEYRSIDNTTGWTYLPSGLLLQWGKTPVTGSELSVNFPRDFDIQCFAVFVTEVVTEGSGETNFIQVVDNFFPGNAPFTKTQCRIRARTKSGNPATTARCVFYAIGI